MFNAHIDIITLFKRRIILECNQHQCVVCRLYEAGQKHLISLATSIYISFFLQWECEVSRIHIGNMPCTGWFKSADRAGLWKLGVPKVLNLLTAMLHSAAAVSWQHLRAWRQVWMCNSCIHCVAVDEHSMHVSILLDVGSTGSLIVFDVPATRGFLYHHCQWLIHK